MGPDVSSNNKNRTVATVAISPVFFMVNMYFYQREDGVWIHQLCLDIIIFINSSWKVQHD